MSFKQYSSSFPVCLSFLLQCSLLLLLLLAQSTAQVLAEDTSTPPNKEISAEFWENLARKRFQQTAQLIKKPMERAKNVILFLGDGMSLQTISASRFFKSEVHHRLGEANPTLYFEDWPFHTMCRTYDLQTSVTDSASSATAYLSGSKTSTGVIGLTGDVQLKSCNKYDPKEKVESVLKAAMNAGMATGIVTTSRVTHASPAGTFAHIAHRDWESDKDVNDACPNVTDKPPDIARQLIEENANINVVLGGGSSKFLPSLRDDGRNLAEEWLATKKERELRAQLITNTSQFWDTDFKSVDYLLGLLNDSHMPYDADRNKDDPSLANFTSVAIKILSRQPNGFFLFVEGARIDQAHHKNRAKKALIEMLAFEDAIREGTQMVDLQNTLVIVTSDHSHSFALVGQPLRNQSLFDMDPEYTKFALDEKGILPLLYTSGPSGVKNTTRRNITEMSHAELHGLEFNQPAFVPLEWATHGGEDVGVYATGTFSQLFHSTVDNTFIAQAMKYALCLRPFEKEPHCQACRIGPALLSVILTFLILHRYYASN